MRFHNRKPVSALFGLVACTLAGCTMMPMPTPTAGAPAQPSIGQPPTIEPSAPSALTSDDLYAIYQALITEYVDRVDDGKLLEAALTGARDAAVAIGLLPIETGILDTAPLHPSGDPRTDYADFGAAYDAFVAKLGGRLDIGAVGRGAARGMLAALGDPLTTYLDRDTMKRMQSAGEGSIGVTLVPGRDGGPPVVRLTDSAGPAAGAGIAPGDSILSVDGSPTSGLDLYDVLLSLSGPAGSQVQIGVSSPGGEPREITVSRSRLDRRSITATLVDGIEMIQLRSFDRNVVDTLRRALRDSIADGASGWVIDVRGNGEGNLTNAVDVASLFVGQQTIAIEREHGGRETTIRGTSLPLASLLPTVVLVDGATAGPGELFAAAIRDYGAGTLVGETTDGRLGTPTVVGLSDGSAAEITTTRIYSPSRDSLLGSGVEPDVPVAADSQALARGEDPVADRAMALLR